MSLRSKDGHPTGAPPLVLVVDADPMAAERTTTGLSNAFEVISTPSIASALDVIKKRAVDVVIADAKPSGAELVASLVAVERTSAIPVILLSSDHDGADADAFGSFPKSTDPALLIGPVRSAVRFNRWVRRHRDVIDGVPIGIVSIDLDGKILEVNRTLGDITGVDPELIVGRHVDDLGQTVDWTRLSEAAMTDGFASTEWGHDRSGSVIDLRIDLRPGLGRDGRVVRFDGIVEDVTDRRRREREIAHSNEQLAALYEVGTRVSGTLELEPVLQTIAAETRRLVAADWSRITLLSPSTTHAMRTLTSGAVPGVADSATGLVAWVLDNAKTAVAEDAASDPRTDGAGDGPLVIAPLMLDGMLGGTLEAGRSASTPFSDIEIAGVEMLAGQASVAVRNAQLWNELTSSHRALQQAHSELGRTQAKLLQVQRLESIGELAAGIAHEINTPIQYVADNTRFLAEVAEALQRLSVGASGLREALTSNSDPSAAIDAFDRISAQVDLAFLTAEAPSAAEQALEGIDRVAKIVRALKEFAHPGAEEFAPVDINHSVETTVAVARNEWKYAATLETDLGEGLSGVPGLAGPLNQSLLNVLVNAAHAVAEAGKTTGELGRIVIRTRAQDGDAVIQISDTGTGIPDHILDRIFDPFFTTKEVGRGSGQGLAIARNAIVEQHGGAIEVETEPGAGTTFTIKLPLEHPKEDR